MNTDNKTPPEAMPQDKPAAATPPTPPTVAPVDGDASAVAKPQDTETATPPTPTTVQPSQDDSVDVQGETPPTPSPAVQANDNDDAAGVQTADRPSGETSSSPSSVDEEKPVEQTSQPSQPAGVADTPDGVKDASDAKDAEVAKAEKRGGGPRRVSGVVIGNKADKTARIRIERRVKHSLYGKIIRRRTHLQAHDAENKCQIGDVVTLEESPRFSKTKAWRVIAITPGAGR